MASAKHNNASSWVLVASLALITLGASYGMLKWFGTGPEAAATELLPQYKRIVSLTPAMTETLVALGVGKQLVGISDYCPDHLELLNKERVGTGLTPNYEGIVSLNPDLIVVEKNRQADYRNLEAIAQTKPLAWLTLDEVVASTRELGDMTNQSVAGKKLSDKLLATFNVSKDKNGPSVLLLLGLSNLDGGNLWFIKRNSLHGAALHAVGARNAIDKDIPGAPSVSLEELLRIDPDIIITLVSQSELSSADEQSYLKRLGQLGSLKAVQSQKTGFIVGKHYMGTGPGILTFVEALGLELNRLSGGS